VVVYVLQVILQNTAINYMARKKNETGGYGATQNRPASNFGAGLICAIPPGQNPLRIKRKYAKKPNFLGETQKSPIMIELPGKMSVSDTIFTL
jgi:hypothetical protein